MGRGKSEFSAKEVLLEKKASVTSSGPRPKQWEDLEELLGQAPDNSPEAVILAFNDFVKVFKEAAVEVERELARDDNPSPSLLLRSNWYKTEQHFLVSLETSTKAKLLKKYSARTKVFKEIEEYFDRNNSGYQSFIRAYQESPLKDSLDNLVDKLIQIKYPDSFTVEDKKITITETFKKVNVATADDPVFISHDLLKELYQEERVYIERDPFSEQDRYALLDLGWMKMDAEGTDDSFGAELFWATEKFREYAEANQMVFDRLFR